MDDFTLHLTGQSGTLLLRQLTPTIYLSFNQFTFLEGILAPPFIAYDWPPYFTYGAFGTVIGHELTNGLMTRVNSMTHMEILSTGGTTHQPHASKTDKNAL